MKYKALFVFFFGIVLSLIIAQNSFAGWPIAVSPTVEGTIIDATTEQPIENVIIEVEWDTSVYAFVDRTTGSAGYRLMVTGKEGKYKIPAKVMLQPLGGFFSHFKAIDIKVRHPLYEFKSQGIDAENVGKFGKEGKLKQWDVRLLSLAEKYRNIDRNNIYEKNIPMQIHDLSREMMGNSAANYFKDAAKLGVKKDYFKYIYNSWQVIIDRYNDNEQGYLKEQFNRFKNYYGMDY